MSRAFDRLSEADNAYIDDGIALLGFAKDARRMFAEADFAGKRNILHHLLSNCSHKDGEVSATFRKPFDIIVKSLPRAKASEGASSAKIGKRRKVAPRVGFEPTTDRLTVDCSTAELPRNTPPKREGGPFAAARGINQALRR